MKPFIKWALASIVTLVIPVLLWNALFLDHIDQRGKVVAWLCAPLFAFASAAFIVGMSDAKKPATVKGAINPFWGWFGTALVIEIVIVLLSNT